MTRLTKTIKTDIRGIIRDKAIKNIVLKTKGTLFPFLMP